MSESDRTTSTPSADEHEWYHTIELRPGVFTPGRYDHRQYLRHYELPDDLTGKSVLDIGAASGFFSFELEKRGGRVTALDLPAWMDHDFGPLYHSDKPLAEAERYLHDPLRFAIAARGSTVETRDMSVYDLSAEAVGKFDLVFCGSMLLHLTDPVRALWRICEVTRGKAIIATGMAKGWSRRPRADFHGDHDGTIWWLPNRVCLERMIECAGFRGWRWVSEFRLDPVDGSKGIQHGVVHAWNDATIL